MVSHFPEKEDMKIQLSQMVSEIHVQSVIAYLKKLQLTEEKNKTIINLMNEKMKSE